MTTTTTSRETLAKLRELTQKHLDTTGDWEPFLALASAEDNAGDSGYVENDPEYASFTLESLRGNLGRGSDHHGQAQWFAQNGFIA